MAYKTLYRVYRPQRFDEVAGQEHIITTLRHAVEENKIAHAYLFCGPRGTGKTTIAKLLAKAINCTGNPKPCDECENCKEIASGNHPDVIEIDAASNNGVDEVRNLIDKVKYAPTQGKYKVYIIDEVHMLSTGAFNALLKTLEEPPSYVIFILATTEVQKIPVTVMSRCQRYDFKRITVDTIVTHLQKLTEAEHISVEDKALAYIAKAADGAMRDALSLLDQCVAFHYGEVLTYDNVLDVLGAVDITVFSQLFRAVVENRTKDCIQSLEEMVIQGRELGQFVTDFIWYLRNLLILKDQEGAEESLDMSKETIAALKEECSMVDTIALLRYIRLLSELSNQIRTATQKRVLLEVGFIKLCRPEMESDTESLSERIRQLEDKIAQGIPMIPANGLGNTGMITNNGTFAYDPYTGQPLGTSGAAGAGTAGMVNGTGNSAVSGAFPQGTEGQI